MRTALLGLAAATVSTAAFAGELGVETTVGFESRYVFRGVQLQEASFQPAVSLSYGNLYGGAWLALPVGDDDISYGDELDLFAGYSAALGDAVSYDVGFTYYTYPDSQSGFFDTFEEDGSGLGSNTLEIFGGLSFDAIPLSPSIYVYHDFMFDTTTLEGGASYSFPLAESTSFDLGGSLGYVIDDDAGGDYLYGAATADVSYAFSDNASFFVGVRYGGSDIAGGSIFDDTTPPTVTTKASGFWFGLGFTAGF